MASCYDDLGFMTHEWEKHGTCAGVKDSDDFFSQVCSLSAQPLSVMQPLRAQSQSLADMASALKNGGYPVYYVDDVDSQIYISVCASNDGQWKIADVSQFSTVCKGTAPAPGPSPGPSPSPGGSKCIADQHGPACSSDSDCTQYDSCIRCAGSGYCTCVDETTGQCAAAAATSAAQLSSATTRTSKSALANGTTTGMKHHHRGGGLGGAPYMNCGSSSLCGVLVLESGYGPPDYHHDVPCVHGIWPQVGSYGSSQCIAPSDTSDPTSMASCYDDLGFMTHEWEKHGTCAGVKDSDDFFSQVCSLSAQPLSVMQPLRAQSQSLADMASALKNGGYPVYYVDDVDSQIYISVCASNDGQWKIADVSQFSTKC